MTSPTPTTPLPVDQLIKYPARPTGFPAKLAREIQTWNDAILAYNLRYEPIVHDPVSRPRTFREVAERLASLTGKPKLSKQRIEVYCRRVSDQLLIEQMEQFPDRAVPD